ncbi:DNA polymerase III subunit delta' [Cocleimonas sp. KMM 6892]|uniref:DNA polymerase III subunit delta' n=1 Tax=unclassified Cocleimonas TaxID=2639732 RepID=UPI002DBF0563|nr:MULTISPECIES: DNA polymerase III subunit delta' [unclassified Cocleimonas]MEB8432277.1 DNA polymerase III subunit delta' [Cocleimonas sp. KMM 6892]MEC4714637.1 DNA polymerase III subunit delta' [Cocleimonas sp. KMM 6895]MEC4744549.1 DNA polymerase III subunit delta' [Cocleimonas sp. KMM 6896]
MTQQNENSHNPDKANQLHTMIYPWHEKNWKYFVQARTAKHLPHALLLVGEEGIGKNKLAERIARSLMCINPIEFEACGQCQSCKTYESGANPDYTKIELAEDKQQISVDQIRKLSEFLTYSRSFNTHRVAIINPIERMNNNAANSLLKSLEEPANNSVIILVASNLSKILPTIKSRCQLISVVSPTHQQAIDWFKENHTEIEHAELRLNMTAYKPLKALHITDEDIHARSSFLIDLNDIVRENISVVATAKKWEKANLESLLNWQITWVQQLIKASECEDSSSTSSSSQNSNPETNTLHKSEQTLFATIKSDKHWELYQQLIKQKKYIHTSVNTLMFIENMLLLWLEAGK